MHGLIVGATSWGCTLAIQQVRAGHEATILCRTPAEAQELAARRENRRLLPGIPLPERIDFQADARFARDPHLVIFAVPAQRLRENLRAVLPALPRPLPPLVSASKGLEVETALRMSEVITAEVGRLGLATPVAAISGPNIAREIALEEPATTVAASADREVAEGVRRLLMTPAFRVYTNADVVGVELGGALKNVIAIGAGIGEGLGAGANGRAAFLTRGLAEMARLGVALGAQPLTFTGLACLGDLIATAISGQSRNRSVGEQLAHGHRIDEILAGMVHVAEGVETTRAACALATRAGVEMPIARAMYAVLFEGRHPREVIRDLMTRSAQDELSGLPSAGPGGPPVP